MRVYTEVSSTGVLKNGHDRVLSNIYCDSFWMDGSKVFERGWSNWRVLQMNCCILLHEMYKLVVLGNVIFF